MGGHRALHKKKGMTLIDAVAFNGLLHTTVTLVMVGLSEVAFAFTSWFFSFFFFKPKTAYEMSLRDWSSDVCSSDLMAPANSREAPELIVYNAGGNQKVDFRELSAELFEQFWRVGCFGGFLVGREAARRLVPLGRGTMIFTGASASLRGKPGYAQFAAAKAGLRMVAQSMAREYGPSGIHVAHVLIDGGIDGERLRSRRPEDIRERGEDGLLNIEAIAEAYWQIHRQARSAWTHELDLRTFKESF